MHGGFGVKLTFEAKHSHKLIRAYNPYKYTGPNPPKTTVVVHQFFVRVCGTKNEIITQTNVVFFFP
jgi:phosphatidylethanolamine-binding protein (PEBP) family uncharacterized protein